MTIDTALPSQPDGIEDDSRDLPSPVRAAERVREYICVNGDGIYDVIDGHPLYARDLESLRRAGDQVGNLVMDADKLRAQVAELADKLHKANAQIHSLEKATTAYANENDALKDRISDLESALASTENARTYAACSADLLRGHLNEQKPVIEAAKAWAKHYGNTSEAYHNAASALNAAVDALPKPTHWPSIYGGCEDDCPVCKTEKAEVA